MIENLTEISKDSLLGFTQKMLDDGYRFVTATCVDNGDGSNDILYHFDREYISHTAKITVPKGEEVPSISGVYFCAFLVENEMKELFGVNIPHICVDYDGHLLLSDEELVAPQARQITVVNKEADR